jgi:hypothetical protein
VFLGSKPLLSQTQRAPLHRELSNRWIDLDPAGYFLIRVDVDEDEHGGGFISAAHYLNTIDADGGAVQVESS